MGTDGFFTNTDIPTPAGNAAPKIATTPNPYSTYSPAWASSYSFNWAKNASFTLDTRVIGNYTVVNMGSNFGIINTAQPVYPVNLYR